MTTRRTLDAIWADVLNGAVICALGLAFPALLLWMAIQGGGEAFGSRPMAWAEFAQGLFLIGACLMFVRTGLRLLLKSVKELRERDAQEPSKE